MSMHENDDLHDEPKAADARGQGHGNRPAEGARQGTPGEVFHEGFTGSDSASDFLGLDVDMDALAHVDDRDDEPAELAAPTTHLELSEPAGAWNESESVEAAPGDLAGDFSDDFVEDDVETFVAAPHAAWDDSDHLSVEELDDEEFESFEEEDFFDEEAVASGGGRKLALIAIPFVLGIVAVAGVVLVPRMLEKYTDGIGAELARSIPERARTRASIDDTSKSGANQADAANELESAGDIDLANETDPTTEPTTDIDPANGPNEVADSELDTPELGTPELDTSAPTGEPGDALAGDFPDTQPAGGRETDEPSADATATRPGLDHLLGALVGEGQFEPRDTTRDEPVAEELWRTAPDTEWDVIWKGAAVPMEAIVSTQQVLTPRVGGVRVHLSSGEVFDGKLYAVGQNRVWIDARPGRLALDGERVTKIDRLSEDAAAASNGKQVASGSRVRIRVPGGNLFGRILAEDPDGRLTIQTDDGGRVTVASFEVEAVGRSRVRVLD